MRKYGKMVSVFVCAMGIVGSGIVFANTPTTGTDSHQGAGVAVRKMPNTEHSLDEIMYKISRAKDNLEKLNNDLNGHRTTAIDYLTKALDEIKAGK